MLYIYSFEIAAAVICAIVLISTLIRRGYVTPSGKIFRILVIITMISALSDIFTAFTISYPADYPIWFHYLINLVFYVTLNALPSAYALCIFNITKEYRIGKWRTILVAASFIIVELMILTTMFTHFAFYISEDGSYHHGVLYALLFIIDIITLLATLPDIFINSRNLHTHQVITLLVYALSPFVLMSLQLIYPQLLLSGFAASILGIFILVSLENPAEYIAGGTDALNLSALTIETDRRIYWEQPFAMVIIYYGIRPLTNLLSDSERSRRFTNPLITVLHKNFGHGNVFYLAEDKYAVISRRKEDAKSFSEKLSVIKQLSTIELSIGEDVFTMQPHLCVIRYPENCMNSSEIKPIMNSFFSEHSKKSDGYDITDASSESIMRGIRTSKITYTIKDSIAKHKFEIYFQPIYNLKTGKFSSAEALARLHDSDLGFISPEEFIRIATENDLISELNLELFETFCRFVSQNRAALKKLNNISFNLSLPKPFNERFANDYIAIMNKYDIDPSFIIIEMTEECLIGDKLDLILEEFKKFTDLGIRFSMDDFGTGYSNLTSMSDIPFDTIKIDKSLLWQSMNNPKADIVFKDSIEMIRGLNKNILVEGVENSQMAQKIQYLNCDFIQGFYYSAPIPPETFLKFLEMHN